MNMQEIYVGEKRNLKVYTYDAENLIDKINCRIDAYAPEEVFYIINVKKGVFGNTMPKEGSKEAGLVGKLNVVSKNIYKKSKPDAFSSDILTDFVRARNVKEIEFVGIDGGISIGNTVLGAIDLDIKAIINESCIGTIYQDKSIKCREKFKKNRVTYING